MILLVFGTRPEFLKIKPLIDELSRRNKEFYTLFTGQHKDIIPKDFQPTYSLPESNFEGNRLISLLVHIMYNLSKTLDQNPQIKYILVQGDTTSALAGALTAMNHKIKLIHLEAGLRTYDFENPYPEEFNRQIISRMTDIHLCPTRRNASNLDKEKVLGKKFIVGNTILDTLLPMKSEIEYQNIILITLHRRENHDQIEEWFKIINGIATLYVDYKFIMPIHPNPNVQKHRDILNNVNVVDPLSHHDFLKLLVKCRMVITDSGGIQEECSFFNKKAIVCRKITERPESLTHTSFLCKEPKNLYGLFFNHDLDHIPDSGNSPYGDGTASTQIVNIFEQEIYK